MATVTRLASLADAEAMLAASQEHPVYLLKHSTTCPISAMGHAQFVALDAPTDPPLYCVIVQQAREVSNALANDLDVRHETPQAILIVAGTAIHVESHHRIKTAALRAAASSYTSLT